MGSSDTTTMVVVLLALALPLVMVAVILALVRWTARRGQHDTTIIPERFALLRQAMGAEEEGAYDFGVTRDHRRYDVHLQPAGRNTPCVFSLVATLPEAAARLARGTAPYRGAAPQALEVERIVPLLLRPETSTDRIGKWLFINQEVQTGSAEFDERVYIETTATDQVVQHVLADPRIRNAVEALLETGWSKISLYQDHDTVKVERITPQAEHLAPPQVAQSLDVIGQLAQALPVLQPRTAVAASWGRAGFLKLTAGLGIGLGIALGLIAHNVFTTIEGAPYAMSALAGLLLWVLHAPFAGLLLRGRSDSFRSVLTVLAMNAVGLPTLCIGLLIGGNGALDGTQPKHHTVPVTSLRVSSGKSTSYYARLTARWRPEGGSPEFKISRELYEVLRAREGNQRFVTITVRPGALGWQWYSSIRAAQAPD